VVGNFSKIMLCKGNSFSIKNIFSQNNIIVLTTVISSIYIVKFEKIIKNGKSKVVQGGSRCFGCFISR
jgi:hypothetical protein